LTTPQTREIFIKDLENYYEDLLSLIDINDSSENNIDTASLDGFIAHYQQDHWRILKKATDAHLNSIFVFALNDIIIVGVHVILKGNAVDGFCTLFKEEEDFDLYDVAIFKNSIHIASCKGLYLLKDKLIPVNEKTLSIKPFLM